MEVAEKLIGQEGFARWYEKTESGGLPQTLLFAGPFGVGKKTAACLVARDLHKSSKESHPDTFMFSDWVAEMRARNETNPFKEALNELAKWLQMSPFESATKVVIIDSAEEVGDVVQNGLLKILEEPRPNVVMILTAENEQRLLPTILSRATVIRFRELTGTELKEIVPEASNEMLEVAAGSAGRLRQFVADEKFWQTSKKFYDFWVSVDNVSTEDKFVMTESIKERAEAVWFARVGLEVLRAKLKICPDKELAEKLSRVQETFWKIEHNANQRMALEALLLVF
jgi:hypothetical protein